MFSNTKQFLLTWLIKMVQKYGPHKVEVLGNTYEVSEQVFNPKYYNSSKFMAEHLRIMPGDVVLDIGTGSGIQAITAAQKASKVIAIDINPEAVRFARKNVISNGVENVVSVIQGDLFSPLGSNQKFSIIIITPPWFEGSPETDFDYALFDSNKRLIKRFFDEAGEYLEPNGYVQLICSSMAGHKDVLKLAEKSGWNSRVIAEKETFFEKVYIYKLTLS